MPKPTRLPLGQRLLDYLLQVSLIILGLIIATSVDRCNAARKDDQRLQAYYTAILQDLGEEQEINTMNGVDADHDVRDLEDALRLFRRDAPDSLALALQKANGVLRKGVFRTFSPTTFDVMVNTGDVNLIEDIRLRAELASVFAYRNNILRPDLQNYDHQVLQTIAGLSDRIDPACMVGLDHAAACLLDPDAIRENGVPELWLLYAVAHTRRFHLQVAAEQVQEAAELVAAELQER